MKRLTSLFLFSSISFAQTQTQAPKREEMQFEYPELLVVPSASDRLNDLSKSEPRQIWTQHWTLQAPALITLAAGLQAMSDPGRKEPKDGETALSKTAGLTAAAIGGAWIGLTVGLSATYAPYGKTSALLRKQSRDSKSARLAYERTAEEGMMAPAQLASTLKWLSFTSNFVAGAFVVASTKNQMPQLFGALSLLGSFTPILFDHPWELQWELHQDYKKRIYGPITLRPEAVYQNGAFGSAFVASVQF